MNYGQTRVYGVSLSYIMGFIENVEVKIDIQKELEKLQKNIDDINNATSFVNRFGVGTFESHMKTISVDVPRSTRYTFF